jgi:hypothetical protein
MKKWLDTHVVPLTKQEPRTFIYSFIWNGTPAKQIMVWLMTGQPPEEGKALQKVFDPQAWPLAAKRLLQEEGFFFDFTRETQLVRMQDQSVIQIFGGDGAPLYNPEGTAALRLFKKVDNIELILQVGCKYPDGKEAGAATKGFYAMFDESPMEVVAKYTSPWGAA